MLSDTLDTRLGSYRLGAKIRALRLAKGLGLAQLGEHSGYSAGMLSRIETGQVVPTLPTLMRIAMVFGVGLEHFFADSAAPVLAVVRRDERLSLPNRPDGQPAFHFESLDFPVTRRQMEAYRARFDAGAAMTEPHQHAGDEVIYVIEGCLDVLIHGRTHRLEAGDSMYFEAGFPHRYGVSDDTGCEAMVVVSVVQ
ncbi:cupin domain-containing protein [Defluviimonas aestuarii]|uniref:helix-turn-helix domain-containing protein n=1 Tax=Albidovulum aestuarii TaxID=1130726 RepID=UPI00249B5606|nr:cupin domain-containing protein [Defluviimonas aestuarii]MDI3336251.1 cupin domain-containing protein [Defluviimonas aestuarii]